LDYFCDVEFKSNKMKKALITLGSIAILAFVTVVIVNASSSDKDTKKAKTEVSKEAKCDPATCPAHKDGAKCDPATCPAHKDGAKCDPATCAASKECEKKCGGHEGAVVAEEKACDPAKCTSTCTKTCGEKK